MFEGQPWARASAEGWRLSIRVQPGARSSEVVGTYGEQLRIRVAAPAVDGKANEALVDVLATHFGIARNQLTIVRGHTSRSKIVAVETGGKRCKKGA